MRTMTRAPDLITSVQLKVPDKKIEKRQKKLKRKNHFNLLTAYVKIIIHETCTHMNIGTHTCCFNP